MSSSTCWPTSSSAANPVSVSTWWFAKMIRPSTRATTRHSGVASRSDPGSIRRAKRASAASPVGFVPAMSDAMTSAPQEGAILVDTSSRTRRDLSPFPNGLGRCGPPARIDEELRPADDLHDAHHAELRVLAPVLRGHEAGEHVHAGLDVQGLLL